MVKEINIDCIARLVELRTELRCAIPIDLQLKIGVCIYLAAPSPQEIFAGIVVRLVDLLRGRGRIKRDIHALPVVPLVHVSLQRERIARVQLPVCSETTLPRLPIIEGRVIRMKLRGAAEPQAIHAKIEAVSVPGAVADLANALINIPAADRCETAVGILCAFGDNVDDAVDSVCSPDRAAGPANQLDS